MLGKLGPFFDKIVTKNKSELSKYKEIKGLKIKYLKNKYNYLLVWNMNVHL